MQRVTRQIKRIAIGVVGSLVLLVGIVAIPYPGPGWLIVFAGLAILAAEFDWAKRVLLKVRGRYDRWQLWIKRQSAAIKAVVWSLTALVVVVTIYLLNGYGYINDWLNLGLDWVRSPLGIFK